MLYNHMDLGIEQYVFQNATSIANCIHKTNLQEARIYVYLADLYIVF